MGDSASTLPFSELLWIMKHSVLLLNIGFMFVIESLYLILLYLDSLKLLKWMDKLIRSKSKAMQWNTLPALFFFFKSGSHFAPWLVSTLESCLSFFSAHPTIVYNFRNEPPCHDPTLTYQEHLITRIREYSPQNFMLKFHQILETVNSLYKMLD